MKTFSPLFIGARIVTGRVLDVFVKIGFFQSPFHRGKDCNMLLCLQFGQGGVFQSPFHRGKDCNHGLGALTNQNCFFQSPFHRGKDCNTGQEMDFNAKMFVFQSPFHRGKDCNSPPSSYPRIAQSTFSPLFIGARIVTDAEHLSNCLTENHLSVPFSSGQGL